MRAAIAVVVVCLATTAAAHPLDTGYLRVDAQGDRFTISFDIDVVVAGDLLKTEPGAIDPVLVTRATELADRTYRTAPPVAGGTPCTWGTASATRKGQTVSITESATCPPGDVTWDLSFVKKLASTFQILGKVNAHGVDQVITVDKNTPVIEFPGGGDAFVDGIWNGLAHTGVLPRGWPNGLEHVLFVILIALAAGTFRRSAIAVAMVIAGSLVGTFLLATLRLPPTAVMIGVAAWIAGIAVIAATRKADRQVWLLGGIAGACHGAIQGPGNWIGYEIGFSLGHVVLALVIAPPLAMAMAQDRVVKYVPYAAIACGLGAIAFVVRGLV